MRKGFLVFIALIFAVADAFAVSSGNKASKKFQNITSYNDVYPYVLNNVKTTTNTKKTAATTNRRAVVPRATASRATSNTNNQQRRVVQRNSAQKTARSAATTSPTRMNSSVSTRAAASSARVRSAGTARSATVTSNYSVKERPSSQRCMADYKECMENYCKREDTAYNRCYCSAKLAQIDSKYQTKIDELIQQIVKLQYNTDVTSSEIKEYWDQTVGTYTKDNPWVNIDNALNIEWADSQSRIRGQNAFNTGHQYCVQHLKACYYMASNLRDAYKSEIARDCEAYEKSLQKIQDAAESVIESYHD